MKPTAKLVRGLTARERQTLAAITDRIFPRTETPGAVDAGAVDYIVQALAGPYRAQLRLYRRGLKVVEQCAQARHRASFAAVSEAGQDLLLRALESGESPAGADGAAFFEMAREHVLEGVFCEPIYGGNRDLVGWRMVGFPGQRTGYPDAYINQVVDLPPVAASQTSGKSG